MENYLEYEFVKQVTHHFHTRVNRCAADIAANGFVDEDLQRTLYGYEQAGYKVEITNHQEDVTQYTDGTCKVYTYIVIKLYKKRLAI